MDKNTITGFVLIALVLIGFSWWSQPSEQEFAKMQNEMRQDSIRQAQEALQAQREEEKGRWSSWPRLRTARPCFLMHGVRRARR